MGDVRLITIDLRWQPYEEEVGDNPAPRWRVFPEISGGGHFHDLASHQFDFLEYAFGPIKTAKGIARNQAGLYKADDITVAGFEFESGILGTGNWCYTVNKEQRIDKGQIIGSAGKIIFSFFESPVIQVETASGIEAYNVPYPPHVQQPLVEKIVQQLRGEGQCPSTGETAARANYIMDLLTAP